MKFQSYLLCTALAFSAACADSEPTEVIRPSIVTAGGHGVEVGATVQVTAQTENGDPEAYVFSSSDSSLFTVTATGVVTGVAAGEGFVLVTGESSGVDAEHAIVVLEPEQTIIPPVPPEPAPFEAKWMLSAHADDTAEAFTHWDEDGEIPASCARCHSKGGFIDFVGDDGTAAGSVETSHALGTTVDCNTCHTPGAGALTSVSFPGVIEDGEVVTAGAVVEGLGAEARCMVCHQGRASTVTVDAAIADAEVADDDTISGNLGFNNIHYYPAGATLYAGEVAGGYQYDGQPYDRRFRHVEEFNTCVECHDPHSLQIRYDACVSCHPGATDRNGAHDIRMIASKGQDYDGDGNRDEGIFYEIETLSETLLAAIQRYAVQELSSPICYANAYPYFFKDTDADGECSGSEGIFPNRYQSWTARLVRATYNYQMASKEPGAFAHNAKYIIQLLYDSLADINLVLDVKDDLASFDRTDGVHFNGVSAAAQRFSGDASIRSSCSRCHSGEPGFSFYVEFGVGLEVPGTSNGLECSTCHSSFGSEFAVRDDVTSTDFPGGVTLELPGDDNICSTCHAGRTGKADIDDEIAGGAPYSFQNIHYRAAAATINGTDAKVGYEYDMKEYAARKEHTGGVRCTSCHEPVASDHTFSIEAVWPTGCNTCHKDEESAEEVRDMNRPADYDGIPATIQLNEEVDTLAGYLLEAMWEVSNDAPMMDSRICYGDGYPYWFNDTDVSGPECDESEVSRSNSFDAFTPELLKASHNYQFWHTEPGAWAHNFDYIFQLLYDSIEDLGDPEAVLGDVTRPPVD